MSKMFYTWTICPENENIFAQGLAQFYLILQDGCV